LRENSEIFVELQSKRKEERHKKVHVLKMLYFFLLVNTKHMERKAAPKETREGKQLKAPIPNMHVARVVWRHAIPNS
jgi:hypothetical protein